MKRSKTSKAWMKEHVSDFFVKQAQKDGYRSRAAYKLLEIAEKDAIFKPGFVVVDLGAAPGSWSQVASQKIGPKGKVIALDILPMQPLPGVEFIQNDFREEQAIRELHRYLDLQKPDLIISDMAPNISGITVSDQAKSMHLAELALMFSVEQLNFNGSFLVKVFQGRDFEQFHKEMRNAFEKVIVRKPRASRERSNELYLLGIGRKDNKCSLTEQ